MAVLARRRARRRAIALVAVVAAAAAVVVVSLDPFGDGETPGTGDGVPTVPVAATPADIGCIDEPGTVQRPAADWLSYSAAGSIATAGEISSSIRIGGFSRTVLEAVADSIGTFRTSEVRDLSPSPGYCVTHRVVVVEFDDGTEVEVTAMRLVAQASPQWIPNDAAFVFDGVDTWRSDGTGARSAVVVGSDGTVAVATAFGPNARGVLDPPPDRAPRTSAETFTAPSVDIARLAEVARAALAFSVSR